MIVNITNRSNTAITRIFASLIAASEIVRTLYVRDAFRSLASYQGISPEIVRAIAARLVVRIRTTEGVQSALRVRARIDALAVHACVDWGTVGIRSAAD